jgi:hypothetical protein
LFFVPRVCGRGTTNANFEKFWKSSLYPVLISLTIDNPIYIKDIARDTTSHMVPTKVQQKIRKFTTKDGKDVEVDDKLAVEILSGQDTEEQTISGQPTEEHEMNQGN